MQTNLKHMEKLQNRRNKDNQNLQCHLKKKKNSKKYRYDLEDRSEVAFIKTTAFQPAPSLENINQASEFYKTP